MLGKRIPLAAGMSPALVVAQLLVGCSTPALGQWHRVKSVPSGGEVARELDTRTGAGPRSTLPDTVVESRGARLEPRKVVPRPWFGVDAFDGAKLIVDGGQPIVLPAEGAPTPRRNYLFARLDGAVAIWGGLTVDGKTNTGAVFDLATRAWRPMTTEGAPEAREYPLTSTWTGDRLIVWSSSYTGKHDLGGAYYDPKADRWTELPTTNAPRVAHGIWNALVMWTGRELVVLGAAHSQPVVWQSGGVLEPGAEQWRPLPLIDDLFPTFAVRAFQLADGRLLLVRAKANVPLGVFLFDVASGTAKRVPLPEALKGLEGAELHVTPKRLFVGGGERKTMTHPGDPDSCRNAPPGVGCDPVGPTFESVKNEETWAVQLVP